MTLRGLIIAAAVASLAIAAPVAATATEDLIVVAGTGSDDGTFVVSSVPFSYIDDMPQYQIEDGTGAYASDPILNISFGGIFSLFKNLLIFGQAKPITYDISGGGTLTATSVPEPASWALMIVGVVMAGVGMRSARRRKASGLFRA